MAGETGSTYRMRRHFCDFYLHIHIFVQGKNIVIRAQISNMGHENIHVEKHKIVKS